jgi:hypothetical protein
MNLILTTKRVEKMEKSFDACSKASKDLADAIDNYKKVLADFAALSEYYDGGEWKNDYEADEKGLIPASVKRGVLSQDGLYDLLSGNKELTVEMLKLLTQMAEQGIR